MRKAKFRWVAFLAALALVVTGVFGTASVSTEAKKSGKIKKVVVKNVKKRKLTLKAGKKFKLKAKVVKKGAVSKKLKFKSSKKSVATVSSKGVIKALKAGTTIITVSAKAAPEKKAAIKVTVKKGVLVKKVSLDTKSLTLYTYAEDYDDEDDEEDGDEEEYETYATEDEVDESEDADTEEDSDEDEDDEIIDEYQLETKVLPSNASNKELTFTTSDEDVAEVDDEGYVLAVGEGTAVITAKATDGSGKKATCKVTVIDNSDEEDDGEEEDEEETVYEESSFSGFSLVEYSLFK